MLDYDYLIAHLKDSHDKVVRAHIEKNPFVMNIDEARITTIAEFTGRVHHLPRKSIEECLWVLEQDGKISKEAMDGISGLTENTSAKLFAIIAYAKLPGVTATDSPRTLFYRRK